MLPESFKHARELALTKSQYVVPDHVLYYVVSDKTLRIIPPLSISRETLSQGTQWPIWRTLTRNKNPWLA